MIALRRWRERLRTSRIGLRVLAFNLLVLFLPVGGILYLDVYEARLLDTQERGMIQSARVLAAALGERESANASEIDPVLGRFAPTAEARFRIFDRTGTLVSDSSRLAIVDTSEPSGPASVGGTGPGIRERALYRVGAWIARLRSAARRTLARSQSAGETLEPASGVPSEVRGALQGRYGAATRATPGQRSLTLHSAVPIWSGGQVVGAPSKSLSRRFGCSRRSTPSASGFSRW